MTGSWSSFTRSMTAERLERSSVDERLFMGVMYVIAYGKST
jgi:hypothetical protein